MIKRIQGHYGAAIKNNAGNLESMTKAIWAIWKHRSGDHSKCDDWCPSKKGDISAANKNVLPPFVMKAIKPLFVQLSSPGLLQKCLHGGTQNANEAFHHLIWQRCPKTTFVGRKRLEIAVNQSVYVRTTHLGCMICWDCVQVTIL